MKRSYGWVVVGAGALMGCVAIGTVFSLAVFLQPMSEATGWSRTGISSAMTIVFVAMGLGAFGWGALTDRFGPMVVVLSGGLLLGLGVAEQAAPPVCSSSNSSMASWSAVRLGRSSRP